MAKLIGNVAPFDITEVVHPAHEFLTEGIIVRGARPDVPDTRRLARLLRARRERPCSRRTAECSQQLSPSDGDCHTPHPCEVRKGNDTTPRACCPNSAAADAGKAAGRLTRLLSLRLMMALHRWGFPLCRRLP